MYNTIVSREGLEKSKLPLNLVKVRAKKQFKGTFHSQKLERIVADIRFQLLFISARGTIHPSTSDNHISRILSKNIGKFR